MAAMNQPDISIYHRAMAAAQMWQRGLAPDGSQFPPATLVYPDSLAMVLRMFAEAEIARYREINKV